jgi:anti-sigma regulatory factor (Ser/Thr protein kinase)
MIAARASGTDVPCYSETWPCEPQSAEKARRLVSAALSLWGAGDVVAVGELIASELATNAIRHSGCRLFRIKVSRPEPTTVRILISDTSRVEPVLRAADAASESGRGLRLVADLSTQWGCDRRNWGKRVWAEMAVSAE